MAYSINAATTKATINTATPAEMRASISFGIIVNPFFGLAPQARPRPSRGGIHGLGQ
jgi:hypothetical protein